MSALPRVLDLSDDGQVGLVDALWWVVVLSGLGLAVLAIAGAIFTALLWTVKGIQVSCALAWRGARLSWASVARGVRWALSGDRVPPRLGRPGSHHPPPSST